MALASEPLVQQERRTDRLRRQLGLLERLVPQELHLEQLVLRLAYAS